MRLAIRTSATQIMTASAKTIIGETLNRSDNTFVGRVGKFGPAGRNVIPDEIPEAFAACQLTAID